MLTSLVLAAFSLVPGALAAPAEAVQPAAAQGGPYYYSYWSEGSGNYRCNNGPGATYTANWKGNNGGFVCGKGWSPGGNRSFKYSGTYDPTGPGYLSLYGWTRNPLVEYYIVESHGDLSPNEPWYLKGNFTSDEGTYLIYQSTRVNKPSILGTSTFQQYWSVRTEKRVGGTITTGKHFQEWNKLGLKLGGHDYMIMATEGYTSGKNGSQGTASITLDA